MKYLLALLFMLPSIVHASGFEGGMLVLDPSTVTTSSGENNNVVLTGSALRVTVSNDMDSITGFDPGQARGNLLFVTPITVAKSLVFKNNSSSSSAPNRIISFDGQDIVRPFRSTTIFKYDEATTSWYEISLAGMSLSSYTAEPANPTSTTSGTGVMMGLAGAFTPTRTGKIFITICGNIANDSTGYGSTTRIRYGTGTAPANAAALTGTAVGNAVTQINGNLALFAPGSGPFTVSKIVSGLTLGTAYWIDLSLARVTGGTASVSSLTINAIEI